MKIAITFTPMKLGIDIGGRDLNQLSRDALGEIGEMLVASTARGFQEGRAPDGTHWAPNSPVTVALKGHGRVLFHTGRLAGSIQIVSLTNKSVQVGPATPDEQQKAIKLQYAGVVPSGGGTPIKRPMLGISEYRGDIANATEIIERIFSEVFK